MSFRNYIRRLEERVNLITVSEPISTNYEMAGVLKELEPVPVLFENVREANLRVVGNLLMLVVISYLFAELVTLNHLSNTLNNVGVSKCGYISNVPSIRNGCQNPPHNFSRSSFWHVRHYVNILRSGYFPDCCLY